MILILEYTNTNNQSLNTYICYFYYLFLIRLAAEALERKARLEGNTHIVLILVQ